MSDVTRRRGGSRIVAPQTCERRVSQHFGEILGITVVTQIHGDADICLPRGDDIDEVDPRLVSYSRVGHYRKLPVSLFD